jgi:c-di-GMP-binding flagellar brake protein YcgR
MNTPEKRKHSRLAKFLYVQYAYFTKYNYVTKIFEAVTKDISSGGLSISSKHYIPEKTKVSMLLSPKDAKLKTCGEVVWVRKAKKLFQKSESYNIGLKFSPMKDTDAEKIVRL